MHRRVVFLLVTLVGLAVSAVISMRAPETVQTENPALQVEVACGPQGVDQSPSLSAVQNTRPQPDLSPDSPPIGALRVLATPLQSPIAAAHPARASPASPTPTTRAPSTRQRVPTESLVSEGPSRELAVQPPTISNEEPLDTLVKRRGSRPALLNPPSIFRGIAGSSDVLLEIDRGVQRPVALLENRQNLSPQQADAKDRIAEDFAEKVSEAARNRSGDAPPVDRVWLEEQARANERYRLFFGDDAYNLDTVRAAQEALAGP